MSEVDWRGPGSEAPRPATGGWAAPAGPGATTAPAGPPATAPTGLPATAPTGLPATAPTGLPATAPASPPDRSGQGRPVQPPRPPQFVQQYPPPPGPPRAPRPPRFAERPPPGVPPAAGPYAGPDAWAAQVRPPAWLSAPALPQSVRPTYRELLPVTASRVSIGTLLGALWMLLFGLLADTARGYAWLSLAAGVTAWTAAALLARFGDRGIAAGVSVASGFGVAVAVLIVVLRRFTGEWILW